MRKLKPLNHKKAKPKIPMKVGKPYNVKEKGRLVRTATGIPIQRKFTYKDVVYDCGGWADASRFMPDNYDLVCCKLERGTKMGWAHGFDWEGHKIKPEDQILYWKKMKGEP